MKAIAQVAVREFVDFVGLMAAGALMIFAAFHVGDGSQVFLLGVGGALISMAISRLAIPNPTAVAMSELLKLLLEAFPHTQAEATVAADVETALQSSANGPPANPGGSDGTGSPPAG